ncbi:hypothetical protein EDF56_106272 [Novosphingobium sp. PhB165]|uniref:DUF2171 domain-containing protein n=1 Tax=Novosphingobium sp. PhB165 TaxID=2485105 RepID=UPI0010D07260|nr:DUF2171 domain-containing protein [Novosphingobium sp. PhB165]TCM17156.1 hypothetical protein EDF56_106272 [Novosphingobium sp. PhB165]
MSDDGQTSWPTESGFVRKGMTVIDAEGAVLGVVDRVDGQEVLLAEAGHPFITVSEIDGIDGERILLAPRGDATFGLGAEP